MLWAPRMHSMLRLEYHDFEDRQGLDDLQSHDIRALTYYACAEPRAYRIYDSI